MTALSADFSRKQSGVGPVLALGFAAPVAASTTIYKGSLVAINASGNAVPASANRNLRVIGVSEENVDNSAGSAGDKTVAPRRGTFIFANSATTAAVSDADIGRVCYVVDDNTVARIDSLGTRPVAGKVLGVDSMGVHVEVGISAPDQQGAFDVMVLAGADLSARLHHPVKLSSGAAVSTTTAGEPIFGIQQNAPANGAVCIVRVAGISSIILGDTITQGMHLAVEATSGRAKEAVAGTVDTAGGAVEDLDGSYVFGLCITGGADGDTGLCLITHAGAIPTTLT
jgi:hypothetical protein